MRRRHVLVGIGVLAVLAVVGAILGALLSRRSATKTRASAADDPTSSFPRGLDRTAASRRRSASRAALNASSAATEEPLPDPETEGFRLSVLAIGDWGRTVVKDGGSCCRRRKTFTALDYNAMEHTATLLGLAAGSLEPRPAAVLGHGDNFYWTGLQSARDQAYRFQETFETKYDAAALRGIPWINVLGNHDYGGASYLCSDPTTDAPARCGSTDEMLASLRQKFTLQASYVSPNANRWVLRDHFYVYTLTAPPQRRRRRLQAGDKTEQPLVVEIYNLDTNDADTHGARQICCQCYGFSGGDDNQCEGVTRGQAACAGGDTGMYDACMQQLSAWGRDSRARLAVAANASTATWKLVNTHYSPYNHYAPEPAEAWRQLLAPLGIQLYLYGHTHGEKHDYASYGTHFIENGAGGGIQNESPSGIPPYAEDYVEKVWAAGNYPYGFFAIRIGPNWLQVQFMTFDDRWVFAKDLASSVTGGIKVGHCWYIPRNGGRGRSCAKASDAKG